MIILLIIITNFVIIISLFFLLSFFPALGFARPTSFDNMVVHNTSTAVAAAAAAAFSQIHGATANEMKTNRYMNRNWKS